LYFKKIKFHFAQGSANAKTKWVRYSSAPDHIRGSTYGYFFTTTDGDGHLGERFGSIAELQKARNVRKKNRFLPGTKILECQCM